MMARRSAGHGKLMGAETHPVRPVAQPGIEPLAGPAPPPA